MPVTFAVAPPQTEPDYDIVGVELSQGVQRETASARPAPPDRDAPYDGVILAGTKGEWGHPESFSGEVPAGAHPRLGASRTASARSTAPPPELWVSLGRSHATRNGAVVRYGEAPLLSAPTSVPVTPETGLSPGDAGRRRDARTSSTGCPTCRCRGSTSGSCRRASAAAARRPTTSVTIRGRGSRSRACGRPTSRADRDVRRERVRAGQRRAAAATTPGPPALPVRAGRQLAPRSAARDLARAACATRRRADGEPYRTNDRFFTDSSGPMTSLAPFVLGATPAGQVDRAARARTRSRSATSRSSTRCRRAAGDAGERRADGRAARPGRR